MDITQLAFFLSAFLVGLMSAAHRRAQGDTRAAQTLERLSSQTATRAALALSTPELGLVVRAHAETADVLSRLFTQNETIRSDYKDLDQRVRDLEKDNAEKKNTIDAQTKTISEQAITIDAQQKKIMRHEQRLNRYERIMRDNGIDFPTDTDELTALEVDNEPATDG